MQCGRRISDHEIEQICETVELFPHLALRELVATTLRASGLVHRSRWAEGKCL